MLKMNVSLTTVTDHGKSTDIINKEVSPRSLSVAACLTVLSGFSANRCRYNLILSSGESRVRMSPDISISIWLSCQLGSLLP